MEPIEGSETSAYNNQTPGKHPKEYIIDSKHGESLKSRTKSYFIKITQSPVLPHSHLSYATDFLTGLLASLINC